MNRHEGVSCDACMKGNFRGRRYKCLMCFDYDLCAQCYEQGATTTRHTTDHPMQCILTRADFELYYGGEVITVDQPQSYTCPYCSRMGFTDVTLQEHVSTEHPDTTFEVVCPVCAAMVGGDPNMVTDDLTAHLAVEHRTGVGNSNSGPGPRDLISFLDDPSATGGSGATSSATTRHGVRRTTHGPRGVTGARARRSNMHFNSSGGLSSLSPSARDTVDPIAELLSQLSGVRRSAGGGLATSSPHAPNNPTQLQQLQMQLQMERQQLSFSQAARQQLERLPRRQTAASSAGLTATSVNSTTTGPSSSVSVSVSGTVGPLPPSGICTIVPKAQMGSGLHDVHPPSSSNYQFLLSSHIDEPLTEAQQEDIERLRANRSEFVQELLLATIASVSTKLVDAKPVAKSSRKTSPASSITLSDLKQALPAPQALSGANTVPAGTRSQGMRPRAPRGRAKANQALGTATSAISSGAAAPVDANEFVNNSTTKNSQTATAPSSFTQDQNAGDGASAAGTEATSKLPGPSSNSTKINAKLKTPPHGFKNTSSSR